MAYTAPISVVVAGVALPIALGVGACADLGFATGLQNCFIGAMLAATSVGITARVLDENGLLKTRSAEVILGAAVIDDVLGIMLLAVPASVVVTGEVAPLDLVWIVAKALSFTHGVFGGETYSAVIMVVLLTTLVGPLLLKPRLAYFPAGRHRRNRAKP